MINCFMAGLNKSYFSIMVQSMLIKLPGAFLNINKK